MSSICGIGVSTMAFWYIGHGFGSWYVVLHFFFLKWLLSSHARIWYAHLIRWIYFNCIFKARKDVSFWLNPAVSWIPQFWMCSLKKVLGISLFISFSRPTKFLIFMTLNVNATYNGIKRNFLLRLRVFYFKVKIFHCALLANLSPNCQENDQNQHAMHTVSFDWFLSSLEWIINLEFYLLKLLIF